MKLPNRKTNRQARQNPGANPAEGEGVRCCAKKHEEKVCQSRNASSFAWPVSCREPTPLHVFQSCIRLSSKIWSASTVLGRDVVSWTVLASQQVRPTMGKVQSQAQMLPQKAICDRMNVHFPLASETAMGANPNPFAMQEV